MPKGDCLSPRQTKAPSKCIPPNRYLVSSLYLVKLRRKPNREAIGPVGHIQIRLPNVLLSLKKG